MTKLIPEIADSFHCFLILFLLFKMFAVENLEHFPVHCKCLVIIRYIYMFIKRRRGGREEERGGEKEGPGNKIAWEIKHGNKFAVLRSGFTSDLGTEVCKFLEKMPLCPPMFYGLMQKIKFCWADF